MNDYQYINENGSPRDYYEIVNENGELCKEIERLNNIINKAKQYVKTCKDNDMGIRYQTIEEILQGSDK